MADPHQTVGEVVTFIGYGRCQSDRIRRHAHGTGVQVNLAQSLPCEGVLHSPELAFDARASTTGLTSDSGLSTTSLPVKEIMLSLTLGVSRSQPLSMPFRYRSKNLCKSSVLCGLYRSAHSCAL